MIAYFRQMVVHFRSLVGDFVEMVAHFGKMVEDCPDGCKLPSFVAHANINDTPANLCFYEIRRIVKLVLIRMILAS